MPHYEFRFPRLGKIEAANIELEVRQALEPWHVLGEESTGGGTARYVDSSLERVQVKVRGQTGDRYVVTCNGRSVPLAPTGVSGEAVAGIRYRAWGTAIGPASDDRAARAANHRRDRYLVGTGESAAAAITSRIRAGGISLTFPVNAYEAEGRRLARFEAHGHGAGRQQPAPPSINPDYPFTLDLRRPN